MADYLVDFYSPQGVLFRSERIVAHDDVDAKGEAKTLVTPVNPASYKITRLLKTGNVIIHGRVRAPIHKPAQFPLL